MKGSFRAFRAGFHGFGISPRFFFDQLKSTFFLAHREFPLKPALNALDIIYVRLLFKENSYVNVRMNNDYLLLGYMLSKMHEYQKMNYITGECVTNVSYLYDILTYNTNLDVKVKSVYVVFKYDHENTGICVGHVCVYVNGVLFDPSYQYAKIKDAKYIETFKELNQHLKHVDSVTKTNLLKNCLHFDELAKQINSGECLVSSKDYYHNQANYCMIKEV